MELKIPFNGYFPNNHSIALESQNDIIVLNGNRAVAHFQQNNQSLGIIGLYDINNFFDQESEPLYQLVLGATIVGGARLFKLNETTVALVRDRGFYVIEIINDELHIQYSNPLFFIKGTLDYNSSDTYPYQYDFFKGFVIKDNEFLYIENNANFNASGYSLTSSQAYFKLMKSTWDPVTKTVSKIALYDFQPLPNSSQFRALIDSDIIKIPGSTKYYFYFSCALSSGNTPPRLQISAIMNDTGIIESYFPIPSDSLASQYKIYPRIGVALSETSVVYHDNSSSGAFYLENNLLYVMIRFGEEFDIELNLRQLVPLDTNSYYIITNNKLIPIHINTKESFKPNYDEIIEFENELPYRKKPVQIFSDRFIVYGLKNTETTINSPSNKLVKFNLYEIK